MHSRDRLEKQPIVGHREKDPRAREHAAVEGAERGDHHEHRDQNDAGPPEEGQHRVGGDEARLGHAGDRVDVQVGEVGDQIDPDDCDRAQNDGLRQVALRFLHFARRKGQVGPAVVRPQNADDRQAHAAEGERRAGPGGQVGDRRAMCAAQEKRRQREDGQGQELGPRGDADDESADVCPPDVGSSGKGNRRRRQAPSEHIVLDRVHAKAPQQVLAENDGDATESICANQDKFGPAKQERWHSAPALADVGVEPAGFRQSGGQLAE